MRETRHPDAKEILLRLLFLRYSAEREVICSPLTWPRSQMSWRSGLSRLKSRKDFEPTPGSFCGWCSVMAHCSVMAQAIVPVNILYPTREDSIRAPTLLAHLLPLAFYPNLHLRQMILRPLKNSKIIFPGQVFAGGP